MIAHMSDLFTAREVAELAGRSKSQVNRDAASGVIVAAHQVPGDRGVRLFGPEEVERYLEAHAGTKA